jgi:hypothetical protein
MRESIRIVSFSISQIEVAVLSFLIFLLFFAFFGVSESSWALSDSGSSWVISLAASSSVLSDVHSSSRVAGSGHGSEISSNKSSISWCFWLLVSPVAKADP